MSPAFSLSLSHLPLCKAQDCIIPKESPHPRIGSTGQNPCQKSSSDATFSRRKLFTTAAPAGLGLGTSVLGPARAEPQSPIESASSRLSYTRFLQYLDEGAVRKVDLVENGTAAIVEIFNPALDKVQRVKVQLPGLPPELVRKMKEKNVDFAAYPMEGSMWPAILDLLGNLAFPLIILGSFLLRSSSSNNPGGPNFPFGLGRYQKSAN